MQSLKCLVIREQVEDTIKMEKNKENLLQNTSYKGQGCIILNVLIYSMGVKC
jgi:hypothetical protein